MVVLFDELAADGVFPAVKHAAVHRQLMPCIVLARVENVPAFSIMHCRDGRAVQAR